MSGGHFDYKQNLLEDIAAEIDKLVAHNMVGDPPLIVAKFQETAKTLRLAAAMAQRVDWLVSGDDGYVSFLERWEKEVEALR